MIPEHIHPLRNVLPAADNFYLIAIPRMPPIGAHRGLSDEERHKFDSFVCEGSGFSAKMGMGKC